MYSEWEDMPNVITRPRRARSEVRATTARPFTSLGNICVASNEDPFKTLRSLPRPSFIGSDGGSYNDTTSSDDDRKVLNAPRKVCFVNEESFGPRLSHISAANQPACPPAANSTGGDGGVVVDDD